MAYNDEAVRAKLATLNETQESIVTVAQWIMFHRRHAERTAGLWLEKLKDANANRRLNLIYLANEVVQQSKARKREDFLLAFSPLIPEATAVAFRGAHGEVRNKIKRVVEVWRQRGIFDTAIQDAVEGRIAELEKSQSSGGKKLLGGSLFSGSSAPGPSAPEELKPLVPLQENLNRTAAGTGTSLDKADSEYTKTLEGVASLSLPVQVARYSALFKSLASAENAVAESVRAREDLLAELDKLVLANRDKLVAEKSRQTELGGRKGEIEAKKREVEDAIMRGLVSVPDEGGNGAGEDISSGGEANGDGTTPANRESEEPRRPVTEELTPPPVETITPVDSPEFEPADATAALADVPGDDDNDLSHHDDDHHHQHMPNLEAEDEANVHVDSKWNVPEAGADLLASLSRPFSTTDMAQDDPAGAGATAKRPRMEAADYVGLSNDVDDLIRSEGRA